MKIVQAMLFATALTFGSAPLLADSLGGTGRPSYDNPRDYGRDAHGNETYRHRNAVHQHRHHHVHRKSHHSYD